MATGTTTRSLPGVHCDPWSHWFAVPRHTGLLTLLGGFRYSLSVSRMLRPVLQSQMMRMLQGPDGMGMGIGARTPQQWDRPSGQQSMGPSGQLWDGPDSWQQPRQGGRPMRGFNEFDGPPPFGQQQPGPDMPWSQQQQQQMQLSQQGVCRLPGQSLAALCAGQ